MSKPHVHRVLWVLLLGALAAGSPRAQDLQQLRFDVAYLSSDLLEGRETGTRGERLAAEYIAQRFGDIGLDPAGADGSWYQPFDLRFSSNPHDASGDGEPRTGRNVVARIEHGAAHTVVVGAHYDHLGYGAFGSRQPGDLLIHNGADDNASGVAALLEIARRLAASGASSNDYVFVAFSGEELGLIGSRHFVNDPPVPLEHVNYMINLDMVGRLDDDRTIAVNGSGTSPAWNAVLDTAADSAGLVLKKHPSGLGPSDHASFYLAEIPVLHLFTGQHHDYHKPSDDSHLINYHGISDIASFVVEVVEALDGGVRLAFTSTGDAPRRARFRVTLGIMPDYVEDGEGVRIDAVLDGRPASIAGLQKGDVVIRLGEVDVRDIDDYMEALATFEKGDVTTVVVRRGGERLEREVEFQ